MESFVARRMICFLEERVSAHTVGRFQATEVRNRKRRNLNINATEGKRGERKDTKEIDMTREGRRG